MHIFPHILRFSVFQIKDLKKKNIYGRKTVDRIATQSMSKIYNLWHLIVANCDYAESYGRFLSGGNATASHTVYILPDDSWYSGLALSFGIRSKSLTVEEKWPFKVFQKIISWKQSDILIWPNWWPGVTRIEVLSSYKPVTGFQGGTVGQTAVTKMEKIRHGFCHYSSYTFCPIYILS